MRELEINEHRMAEWRDKLLKVAEKVETEGDSEAADMFFYLAVVLDEQIKTLIDFDSYEKGRFKN